MAVTFSCAHPGLAAKWQAAVSGLRANVVRVHGYDRPVLIEGGGYPGIWLECGPLEGAIFGLFNPQVALDNHRIFFHLQREDGYLPCWVWADRMGRGQIQMVVPVAATAWETFQLTGDADFLATAYAACARWDAWLAQYHDTLGTGLCEAFCEYDTGHDNSPRFFGLPHEARDGDARYCSTAGTLPYVAPDLSATVYGGRRALAVMARQLGDHAAAQGWDAKADRTRQQLLAVCYDAADACFYDRDRNGDFVRIRGDLLTRVLSEHVVDQPLFNLIYQHHLRNPEAFWTPYPLPSIAANDPTFVRALPGNSWGGAAQALTALRAPRWFDYYGQPADLTHLMRQWITALLADDGFRQQMNPWTGQFTPGPATYSPAMLVLVDFVRRLCGPVVTPEQIAWNCGLLQEMGDGELRLGAAASRYTGGVAELTLDGRHVATVRGACRLVTTPTGQPLALVGTAPTAVEVVVHLPSQAPHTCTLPPNARVALATGAG